MRIPRIEGAIYHRIADILEVQMPGTSLGNSVLTKKESHTDDERVVSIYRSPVRDGIVDWENEARVAVRMHDFSAIAAEVGEDLPATVRRFIT